jgi:chorismate mutase
VAELDLDALRRAIDSVDARLLELIHERVRLVLEVGEYKARNGLAIYDPERERRLLERLTALAKPPLEPETVRRIFERLVDESRRLEQHNAARGPTSSR